MRSTLTTLYLLVIALVFVACENSQNTTDKVANAMPKSAKRGVAFNFSVLEDLPILCDAISWNYNWGNTQNETAATWMDGEQIDFCPMCWNGSYSASAIRSYVAAHPNTKYLLAFNEPNLTDQANMTPAQAAAIWTPVVDLAKELKLKLVSPAMNYGTLAGYNDPSKWLDEFFAQPNVSIDDIDAISIHCYMANPAAVKNYVQMFAKYKKPIWVTEFCAWEEYAIHSEEDQIRYMCEVLNYMEQSNLVARYAWFIPRAKAGFPYMQLLTSGVPAELTAAGKVYCGFSSFDKSTWIRADVQHVSAANYSAINADAIQVRPSTSGDGNGLMLSSLDAGKEISYQTYTEQTVSKILLRYASLAQAEIFIYVDNSNVGYFQLPAAGDNIQSWATVELPIEMSKGKHTLGIEIISGTINLSWFQLKKIRY